jgi:pyridinium-3,5-bisthiocarboxylic acid mononucleotide nickel chelatase
MPRPARRRAGRNGLSQAHAHAAGHTHDHGHSLLLTHNHDHHHHGDDHDHDGGHHHEHDGGQHRGHDQGAAHHHEHRDYAEIRRLLKRAKLDADVRELAAEIFALVAQAEAALHGVPLDRIAFHEVGAYDSIADVVGAAAAIAWLSPSSISAGPVVVGHGSVRTAHGLVPIPAPATARLLAGVPVRAEGEGELTTPTGAAILAAVVDRFGAMPPLRLASQGLGAGTKELADRPNVLRVVLGEALGEPLPESASSVTLLETNIDDMSPQLIEPLLGALFAAGAVDAWSAPIMMKKGRPGFTVSALAPAEATDQVAQAFFENSTTIGLRSQALGRTVLARSRAEVKTPYGKVSVKISALDGRVLVATPEFEDCRRLAQAGRAPVRAVLAAASAAATMQFSLPGRRAGTRAKR